MTRRYVAFEVPRERVLGNFRSAKSALSAPKQWRRERLGMSEDHLVLVRQLWCATCGSPRGIEAHHLKSGPARKERGISLKATDKWALSACAVSCHPAIERIGSRNELRWYQDHGVDDPYALAAALWAATGDLERMQRILLAHRG